MWDNIKMLQKLITFIAYVVFLSSCGEQSIKLTDNYTICSEDEFGKGYYLICKLSCISDPKIENIKTIELSSSHIIIQQSYLNRSRWFIIKARGKELKCCNKDFLIGPLTRVETNMFIKSEKIQVIKRWAF